MSHGGSEKGIGIDSLDIVKRNKNLKGRNALSFFNSRDTSILMEIPGCWTFIYSVS